MVLNESTNLIHQPNTNPIHTNPTPAQPSALVPGSWFLVPGSWFLGCPRLHLVLVQAPVLALA
jgi:hypothetical protein